MHHTLANINGFQIEEREHGHIWAFFMATRKADGAGKSHNDLGTLKTWCEAQPPITDAQRNQHAGSVLQEIADKGFAGWLGVDI